MAEREYQVGEEFLTTSELEIIFGETHLVIPIGTKFTIVGKEERMNDVYRISFEGFDVEHNWYRFCGDEIDDFRSSAMSEY